jgi:hypothetical protein
MRFDRRAVLAGAAVTSVASTVRARASEASAAPPAAAPGAKERLIARAKDARLAVAFDGKSYSGPGWDFLVREGMAAHCFLLGEEHGTVEIPKLAAQLMLALKPAGYEKLALEISAPVATLLDLAATNGAEGIRAFNAEYPPGPAFYNFRAEAEFLGMVRRAFPVIQGVLWGLDYEVLQDRRLIAMLGNAVPDSARPAIKALADASAASWKKFDETRNPQFIFSFSGDPALVRAVRTAWPNAGPAVTLILDVLEGTLEANAFWAAGKVYESNLRRTQLMRSMLAQHWRGAKAMGRAPRTFFKFGSSHMQRGRDVTHCYDVGELAASIATLEGGTSFHLAAGPSTGQHGQFNPSTMQVMPGPSEYFEELGIPYLAGLAFPEGMTVVDLRPLRPILTKGMAEFSPAAVNTILGFDAILIMPGTTATAML